MYNRHFSCGAWVFLHGARADFKGRLLMFRYREYVP